MARERAWRTRRRQLHDGRDLLAASVSEMIKEEASRQTMPQGHRRDDVKQMDRPLKEKYEGKWEETTCLISLLGIDFQRL